MKKAITLLSGLFFTITVVSQVDESETGAWYMYFYQHQFKNSQWGIQGDFQYRDWQGLGDLEQLLLRSGVTYKPKNAGIMFTLGAANITSGQFGESNTSSNENRIYQEAVIPNKIGSRVYITHRFRYEQRFVENQNFRTRYRYNLFVNIPFNSKDLNAKTYYAAFYNELFMNGQTATGNGSSVSFFDRNRTYLGLGYVINPKVRVQLGWMNQKTNTLEKGQLQFSLHHNF
jgi:hypothetical protein